MGRPRVIDKEKLLDAAEKIVSNSGAGALSIDAVAQAAKVTKGGVQYAFGTKDALLDAMMDRWEKEFDDQVASIVGPKPGPTELIRGHVEATARIDSSAHSKAAGLMALMVQRLERRDRTREWYRKHFDGLDLTTDEGRRTRLAFIATEGAFFLRGFGFMTLKDCDWRAIMDDIQTRLLPQELKRRMQSKQDRPAMAPHLRGNRRKQSTNQKVRT
jgi:AcrR family transcriptional regulator